MPTTRTTSGSTKVERKWMSIFMLVIEATYKHSKNIVDAMDQNNIIQQDIDNNRTKFLKKTFNAHLKYVKRKDQKKIQDEQKHGECFVQYEFYIMSQFHLR